MTVQDREEVAIVVQEKSLAIAVLTFNRNEALRALIPQLVEQAKSIAIPAYVLVVDNHPDRIAAPVVDSFRGQPVKYAHEPVPGIASARNCALTFASETDLLVFIDDDEVPTPDWLRTLVATYEKYGSAGVVGNVLRTYDVEPDPWIMAGRFFDREPIKTGTPQHAAGTGNLLLDLNQVRELGVTFDPVFGLSGGSDVLFTRQIVRRGGKLVWCAEAPIYEQIPASRLTRRWVLKRAFRIGNGTTRAALALSDSAAERFKVRVKAIGSGAVRLFGGGAKYVLGKLTRNMGMEARGLRTTMRGTGMLTGAVGYFYNREYHQTRKLALAKAQS